MIKQYEEMSTQQLVAQFNDLIIQQDNRLAFSDTLKANEIAEQLIQRTKLSYEQICDKYHAKRGNTLSELGKKTWNITNKYVSKYLSPDFSKVRILDVGTGNGRDIIYGQSLGYDVVGTDNCDGFIKILDQQCKSGFIKRDNYKQCDMRALCFGNEEFDVVRHNATLLHMPVISKGFTADLAIEEAYRVLKKNGLLYILVKSGSALEVYDTKENFGSRIFQFYSHSLINEVVTRNGFTIIYTSDEESLRANNIIDWILLIAQKTI